MTIVAQRTIDGYTMTYHADGTLTLATELDGQTWLSDRELFAIQTFIGIERLAGRITRHEHERQRKEWEREG